MVHTFAPIVAPHLPSCGAAGELPGAYPPDDLDRLTFHSTDASKYTFVRRTIRQVDGPSTRFTVNEAVESHPCHMVTRSIYV